MAKLHELLAVESQLETQATKCRADQANTFEKKRHLFEEKLVVFKSNEEGQRPVTESQSSIQSTVKKELTWLADILAKALDASYQVAEANTSARADVTLDDDQGTILLKSVPATALLELEKRITELSQHLNGIPTLDPAKGFTMDTAKATYKARDVAKNRTKKTNKVVVLYEATDKHPAQVQMVPEDVVIGTIEEQEWSGLITPAEKAAIMSRVDAVGRAVRRARSRANDQEVDPTKKLGKVLFNYILGDVVK